jgi:flagellar L-ring protein FlgH
MPTSSFKIAVALPLLALAACMGGGHGSLSPEFAATHAPPPRPVPYSNGAIFQASHGYAALTSGARAARVGDILTIALVERTVASKSNSASTERSGGFGITPPSTGPLSFFDPTDIATSGELEFDGEGEAAQSNRLNGEISVTVAEVYPNGTMLVKGQKLVNINRGDEYIQISGLVRSADIGPDNRVPSTRVADARIAYSGKGEIARASRQGWLQRFFTMLSPF